ncbi:MULTISPECIES: extracellular solute-binding protein [unclassified Mesorhizobium]|uniref:extracellular solute-binding protein n=1 Tax=unclassified Mesorhizobium TaxID=325217 RepID=UPI000BAF2C13|nr:MULTISPECIES: extracellular solute-binding protein [unclassified Mesorhizobium]PBC24410.1 sugar ABC transporter substrate-binding protein [Mesorhizobium sp. WSM4311]TRD09215.1 extracellular solute-binding protein [Mesorhizobium sp. WSM4305]
MSDLIRISRRRLLASGGKLAAFVAAAGIAPQFIRPGRAFAADALAPGMIGGPTGFEGAERYQYGADTPEGRAIEAAKSLKGAGKAPAKIVLGLSDGSIGQLTQPFPAGAPSIKELWEKETGIPIEIVGLPNGQEFTKTMQDISTKGGAYDIYSTEWNRLGDLAETGGIAKLDDFVAQYKPEWDDPKTGYVDGAKGVSLLNKYRGSNYGVSLDGDFQTWVYRSDLFGDAVEQKAFKDKYGYDLAPPKTWKQHGDIAAFFQRPDKGLFGLTDLRNQGWGYTNWYQRYVSMASPNQFLFGDDGKPLINSEHGIAATNEYVGSLAHHSPDAISWGWPEQYGNFAKGGAAMTCAFSNLPKFLDNPGNKDSAVTGKIGSMLPPGREIDGKLISRSVLWFSLTGMVSSQSKNQEVAYLLLQWLGSARIYAWMSANPGGYLDPFRLSDFSDPLVRQTYHAYHMDVVRETVARTVPTINYPGATAFHNALDENLMASLTKAKTAEQAMADTETEWKKIARRIGEDKLLEAIRTNKEAWPTVLDPIS